VDQIDLTDDILAFLEATKNANQEISPVFMKKSNSPLKENSDERNESGYVTESPDQEDVVDKEQIYNCSECNTTCTNQYEFQAHQEDHRMCQEMAKPDIEIKKYLTTLSRSGVQVSEIAKDKESAVVYPRFQDENNFVKEPRSVPKPSKSKLIITPIPNNISVSKTGEAIGWDDIKISHEPSEELGDNSLPNTSLSTKRKLDQVSENQHKDSKKIKLNRKKIHCKICGAIFETLDEKIKHTKNTHVSNLSPSVSGHQTKLQKREKKSPIVITL